MKTNAEKQEFIALRAQGLSLQKISEQINVSKKTLVNWDKLFLEEIDTLKAMELECLRESYGLTKHAELERIGRLLERVVEELQTRDLSDVKSDRLIELAVRLGSHVNGSVPAPIMRDDVAMRERKEARALMASLTSAGGTLDTMGAHAPNGNEAIEIQSLMKLRIDVLRRYQAGEIGERTAAREMALIDPLLHEAKTAREQERLERIEAIFVPNRPRAAKARDRQKGGDHA